MGRQQVKDAVQRARFTVSEMTGSRIGNHAEEHAARTAQRVARLRDIGWDERADQVESGELGAGR